MEQLPLPGLFIYFQIEELPFETEHAIWSIARLRETGLMSFSISHLKKKPATIVDVSKAAGVAVATVSRVMNNSPLVSLDKSQHVREIMEQLNYQPSGRAMKPKPRRGKETPTYHFALLLRKPYTLQYINNRISVYADMLNGALSRTQELGFHLAIRSIDATEPLPKFKQTIDGLIFLRDFSGAAFADQFSSYPSVTVMGNSAPAWSDHVSYDNPAVGRIASDYLLSRGCRYAVGFMVDRPEDVLRGERAKTFALYFHQQGGEATIVAPGANEVYSYETLLVSLQGAIRAASKQSERPFGLFVTDGEYLSAVYAVLHAEKLIEGKDIIIVSCADALAPGTDWAPKTATIDICSESVGRRAIDRLFLRIYNKEESRKTLMLEPSLVVPD